MHAVTLLSRFMHCCNVAHFKAAKRVLRYVKETLGYGVKFEKAEELKLVGYSDSSGVFSWSSNKQQTVAQSTAETEYIVAATAVQAIWLRKLLSDLNDDQVEATEIKVDN
ncbi:secreted RxLR effector protein 161-like [Gossypium raimondii]|uniref:secreted RxLR effector protein 161-like n=1 Tax=Gossypium raimondii TaxID=29730 RepID=UPI00227A6DCB|nr:secreted RxLR effector protein 161-like [Gossypium raimondii]